MDEYSYTSRVHDTSPFDELVSVVEDIANRHAVHDICIATINNPSPPQDAPGQARADQTVPIVSHLTFNPLIRSFKLSTLLPNLSSSRFHPTTCISGLFFLDFHLPPEGILERSTIRGLSWKFVISLNKILDSVSIDCLVGRVGVRGDDDESEAGDDGERGGT